MKIQKISSKQDDSCSYFERSRNMLKSKHSAEMTIGTIIIIVLALVVLVFLIYAFTRGTGSLNDYISNLLGGGSNVDTVKNSCSAACAANAMNAYCLDVRTVKTPEKTTIKGSCATIATLSYGVEGCSAITCSGGPVICSKDSINKTDLTINGITWTQTCKTGTDKTALVGDSEGKDTKTLKCCVAA